MLAQFKAIKQSKGFSAPAESDADAIYQRVMARIQSFKLAPKMRTIDGAYICLSVRGLNPRHLSAQQGEDVTLTWLPTVSIGAPNSYPLVLWKYATAEQATRVYKRLCAAMRAGSVRSMGDIHQVVASVSSYKWNHGSVDGMTWSEKSALVSDKTLKEISAACDRTLERMEHKPRSTSQALLASRLSTIDLGSADGTERALSVLRRAFRAMRKSKASMLQSKLETLTELTLSDWISALS